MQRRAVLGCNHGLLDIVNAIDQADGAHVNLLQTCFYETAARVRVVARKLLFHLTDAQAVGNQLVRIDPNLIFARGSAELATSTTFGTALSFSDH